LAILHIYNIHLEVEKANVTNVVIRIPPFKREKALRLVGSMMFLNHLVIEPFIRTCLLIEWSSTPISRGNVQTIQTIRATEDIARK
jgi:hypothetical protein